MQIREILFNIESVQQKIYENRSELKQLLYEKKDLEEDLIGECLKDPKLGASVLRVDMRKLNKFMQEAK